jgi:hypothetical protein
MTEETKPNNEATNAGSVRVDAGVRPNLWLDRITARRGRTNEVIIRVPTYDWSTGDKKATNYIIEDAEARELLADIANVLRDA